MITKFKSSHALILFIFLSVITGCEKQTAPNVRTGTIKDKTTTSVVLAGAISDDGGDVILVRGFEFGPSDPPFENDFILEKGGDFKYTVDDLNPGTTYYVQAYAINSIGKGMGDVVSFTTLGLSPEAAIQSVSDISTKSASMAVQINPNSLSTTVTIEWGTSTDFGNTLIPSSSPFIGESIVSFTAEITDLSPGVDYHLRIKAENSLGTTYSEITSFSTLDYEWEQFTDFPGDSRFIPLSFTYNGIGYFGSGSNSVTGDNLLDFWSFNPVTSDWTRLNDCPYSFNYGQASTCLVGSTLYVASEGYIYSYDISLDQWESLTYLSTSLSFRAGFSIDNKPFFFSNSISELYEYDPTNKVLIKKDAVISDYLSWNLDETFVINNEAYLLHKNKTKVEIYHYISQSDSWEKKLEKEFFTTSAFSKVSFINIIDNIAFIGQSCSFSLSEYDDNAIATPDAPSTNVWKFDPNKNVFEQSISFPSDYRSGAGSFTFDNAGYVIGGLTVDSETQRLKYLPETWIMKR